MKNVEEVIFNGNCLLWQFEEGSNVFLFFFLSYKWTPLRKSNEHVFFIYGQRQKCFTESIARNVGTDDVGMDDVGVDDVGENDSVADDARGTKWERAAWEWATGIGRRESGRRGRGRCGSGRHGSGRHVSAHR